MSLDFLRIGTYYKGKSLCVRPKFHVNLRTKDLMIQGGDFYAVWDDEAGLWSRSEQTVIDIVDRELAAVAEKYKDDIDRHVTVEWMWDSDSGSIDRWHKFVKSQMRDVYHLLDSKVTFANQKTKREDYASKRLPYDMAEGSIEAYNKLAGTLYSPEERQKFEWAIGAVLAGDAAKIQKFMVFYGPGGVGKSTILDIVCDIFGGRGRRKEEYYWKPFTAKNLGSNNDQFATEDFEDNPVVSIDQDCNLSRIEDNTRLNQIVSHDTILINPKHRNKYPAKINAFLFLATNTPVKITDAKSGIIRRLIDVYPVGEQAKIPRREYDRLNKQVQFETAAIAKHCYDVYMSLGHSYYDAYIPIKMLAATNDFYDFVEFYYDEFAAADVVVAADAYSKWQRYKEFANITKNMNYKSVVLELQNYFREFQERGIGPDGKRHRQVFVGFLKDKFRSKQEGKSEEKTGAGDSKVPDWLIFKEQESYFDKECRMYPAQYASSTGTPLKAWADVATSLIDILTGRLHYVRVPIHHIVIDFDLKGDDGEKSLEKNLEAASSFPPTYAELSKSGKGIHLHYIYNGDPNLLSRVYADNVEIKVFTGSSSLRRMLTKCNDIPIAAISGGLPLKEEKKGGKMVDWKGIQTEKQIRTMIIKNLNKQYHADTKSSIDYIFAILEEAYKNKDLVYDVSDLRNQVFNFAMQSTHNARYCCMQVAMMRFQSEKTADDISENRVPYAVINHEKLVFFDIEVKPNLVLVCYNIDGNDIVHDLFNPSADEIEALMKLRLVGFNCRKYDNHILYALVLGGYDNEAIYHLSSGIINGTQKGFSGAYNISYADVFDFCSKKQSLKKWEIELGVSHQELGLPWDEPADEAQWPLIAEYCHNDVLATKAVFYARQQDFNARKILAKLSGLTVNDTTRQHVTKIIFGNNKHPQLVYTDLSELFPGYEYVMTEKGPKNMYMGEDASFGGYVYAEPGMYTDVALLDVASLHPHSIKELNLFGEYTQTFIDIMDARIAVKHHDKEAASKLLGGALTEFLGSDEDMDALSAALKIIINSVYGFTSATFDNPFKDPRNVNNIVALRGALFMITLKHEVQKRGFTVAHIKTDSIKIPNATTDIIQFCMDFAKKYGYEFEHECTYSKMCLVNQSTYIAKYKDGKHAGEWTATGTQFQIPYVFKTLFSHEAIEFDDVCETKSVTKGNMYLDIREGLGPDEHDYRFVGRVGRFCPIKPGCGGGELMRLGDNGKYAYVTGTKGYLWLEAEDVKQHGLGDEVIDRSYYISQVDKAVADISQYGDFEWFVSDDDSLEHYMNKPMDVEDEVPFN